MATDADAGADGHQQGTPELAVEWVMLFPNGSPASAVVRTRDDAKALAWARQWRGATALHRRTVIIGRWQLVDTTIPNQRNDGWHPPDPDLPLDAQPEATS